MLSAARKVQRRTTWPISQLPAQRSLPLLDRAGVTVLAGLAALSAVVTDPQLSGWRVSDLVLTGGFAATVVLAGSVARRWTWLWAAGVAGLSVAWPLLLAAVALQAFALVALLLELPARRIGGALVAAGAVHLLLRLPEGPFLGFGTLVAVVATAPMLVSAWRRSGEGFRRRSRLGARCALIAVAFIGTVFAVTALMARDRLQTATQQANTGLRAAENGDSETATLALQDAVRAFDDAHQLSEGWWMAPARALPVMGQHVEALDRLSGVGSAVADHAAMVAADADVGNLQIVDGGIDVEHLGSMVAPLAGLRDTLSQADEALDDLGATWLGPPVRSRVTSLEQQVSDAHADVDVAVEAAEVLPGLLGHGRPRHYFVILGTPAETRELGGFMGNYAELTASDGEVSLTRSAPMGELNRAGPQRQLTDRSVFPDRYLSQRPERFWQNVTGTPDLPTAAEAVRQMWPQSGGGPLDGVIYLDPDGLAALMQLTGPVAMPGHDIVLTADDASEFLLRDQYFTFTGAQERKDFLLDVADTVFDQLTTGTLPGPRRIVDLLGPAARSRHIMVHSFDDTANDFLERIGIDGSIPPVGEADFVGLTSANVGPSKLDAYVQRHIHYEVHYNPLGGQVDATATITVDNDAPPEAASTAVSGRNRDRPPGTAALRLAWYTPFQLREAQLDGRPVPVGANREYGRWAYRVTVEVPQGEQQVVQLQLEGRVPSRESYRIVVLPQPVANPDTFSYSVEAPQGWEAELLEHPNPTGGSGSGRLALGPMEEIRVRLTRS